MKLSNATLRVAAIALLGCSSIPTQAQQATLKLSGVLGQSQSAGADAAQFLGANGVSVDAKGVAWTGEGSTLVGVTFTSGKAVLARKISVPQGINPAFHIQTDGAKVYIGDWGAKVYSFDLSQADPKPVLVASLPDNYRSAILAPASLMKGYAAKSRIFALKGTTVTGYGADGVPTGVVLELPKPKEAPYYNAIGIDPQSGDLLIAGYYPDINIYRYSADGAQVTTGGWPRGMFAMVLCNVGNTPWGLAAGGGAKSLPTPLDPATVETIDNEWTYYGNGVALAPTGEYLYATSQGLLRFDRHGKPLHQRVGGVHDVRTIALTSDGVLAAFVENGGRAVRLALDDEADASFTSNANEPWRVGGGWTGKASATVADGATFLVLDESGKQLWHFDPTQSAKGASNWSKSGTPAGLTAAKGLALGDALGWVLDGARLLEGQRSDLTGAHAVLLPGLSDLSTIKFIAATDDSSLVVADATTVSCFSRGGDGSYKLAWKSAAPFTAVGGVAVTAAGVLVSDTAAGSVTLLSTSTGSVVSKLDASAAGAGFKPSAIGARGAWAVVDDEANFRLVRIKIAK